jgi:hypothetical protein
MNRSNLFSLAPTREQHHILEELAVNCAKLWNEVNYLHRQQYKNYLQLDWNPQPTRSMSSSLAPLQRSRSFVRTMRHGVRFMR